jgi:flagellar biosynthesis GTPase FlhF
MDTQSDKVENVKFYINVEPLGLKFGVVFKKSDTFQTVANFVNNQVKKLGVRFELGRINENKTGAIILTDNLLGDFIETNDEITVYSEDYGFVKNNIPGDFESNSSRKLYYFKSVSDLYKSKNFLKKKRNEKQKSNNPQKKNEIKDKNEERNNENDDENQKSEEENDEKEKEKEKENNKSTKKPNVNNKSNKKENNKNKQKQKNDKKNENTDKKNKKNALSSDDEDEDDNTDK